MKKINVLSELFAFLLILILFNNSFSQVTQEWVARYNGPGNQNDIPRSIGVDALGNVYVTGITVGGVMSDYATIKYNSSGVQQWVQIYNGPGNDDDDPKSMVVDPYGNVYVTGESKGSVVSSEFATIKYNTSGVQEWVQRYHYLPDGANDGASSITIDASGNVYVTGNSYGLTSGPDYATIKYNSSGVQQWVERYNGPGSYIDIATSIAVDSAGNVYVTGYSFANESGYDITTIKYNSSGVQQWVRRYDGPGNDHDYGNSLAVDDSGNVYVIGRSRATVSDYTTIKYNTSGVQQWVQRYIGPGTSGGTAYSIALDALSNVYVTGESSGSGTGSDYTTIKYNTSGVQQWVQRYNGPGNSGDCPYSIAIDAVGNVYVTGESVGNGFYTDFATVKYDSQGVQQWVQRYNCTGNHGDHAVAIAVDALSKVYVTGRSIGNGNNFTDYATIKYSQPVISGTVRFQDNNQPVSSGYVKALRYDKQTQNVITVDSTGINSNGTYMLPQCPPVELDIMAYENDEEDAAFVPTYYVSTIYWENATHVTPDTNLTNIDIGVYRINNNTGSMHIGGMVYKADEEDLAVLKDAIVYSRIGNVFKGYSITGSSGSYCIDSLSSGIYEVICNRMGFYSSLRPFQLTTFSVDTIDFVLNTLLVSIEPNGQNIPEKYFLSQNYPNPFNPQTKIKFGLPEQTFVKLLLFDVLGREVAVLVSNELEAGEYNITWDASSLSSGIYFYRLEAGKFVETRKMVLVK